MVSLQSLHVFKLVDRWGDPDPRPKTWTSGIVTIAVYIFLVVYGVFIALHYHSIPSEQTNDILWSAFMGPYPLTLTCAAETCWVSMSLRGAYESCVQEVPASQLDTCTSLQRGETVMLSTCYALLPSEGIRLYHTGADAEGWDALAPETGLGGASDAPYFGMFSVSDMLMSDMVMPTKAPLRAGVTLMTYVHTMNNSAPEGGDASERHEWFSQILDNDPPPEPDSSPCAADIDAAVGDVHVAVLRMAPDFTVIEVESPPSFLLAMFGEIGGALGSCDEIFQVLMLIWLKVAFLYTPLRRNVHGSKSVAEASAKVAGESAGKASDASQAEGRPAGWEEQVRAMVAQANTELVQRLAAAEAAVARLEEAVRGQVLAAPDEPIAQRRPPELAPSAPQHPRTSDFEGLRARVGVLEAQGADTKHYVELFRAAAASAQQSFAAQAERLDSHPPALAAAAEARRQAVAARGSAEAAGASRLHLQLALAADSAHGLRSEQDSSAVRAAAPPLAR